MQSILRYLIRTATAALPPLIGISAMLLVFIVLNAPGTIAQIKNQPNTRVLQNTIKSTAVDTNKPQTITIPALDITAPVLYSADIENEALFQKLLQDGVVHYPFTASPDKAGNVVLFGHSSGSWLTPGNYKTVFATLDQLKSGDAISLIYQGERYRYEVQTTQVVLPTDVEILQPSKNDRLTLITCYPIGSDAKRFIVTAQRSL